MPYWDWTMPQYRPAKPEKGEIIPQSLQLFLTAASTRLSEAQGYSGRASEADRWQEVRLAGHASSTR